MSSLSERVGILETKVEALRDDVKNLPTRPELDLFKKTLSDVVDSQQSIMETQRELVKFMDKWKLIGAILLILGAMLSKVLDWVVMGWANLTNH
jgi:hypothetical protein